MTQVGVDAQKVEGSWTWKAELVNRSFSDKSFQVGAGGFEHTEYHFLDTPSDLVFYLEYLFDSRGKGSTLPFQNDVFLGIKFNANDVDDLSLLGGVFYDLDYASKTINFRLERRFDNNWKWIVDCNLYSEIAAGDISYSLRGDNQIRLKAIQYF